MITLLRGISMRKRLQGFIVGSLITSILMFSFTGFAGNLTKMIEVNFNSVHLNVNDQPVVVDNILYNGTTYAPIRAVAEMLGKNVGWDQKTNTASINDKINRTPVITQPKDIVSRPKDLYGFIQVIKINDEYYLHQYAPHINYDDQKKSYVRLDLDAINVMLSYAYNDYNIIPIKDRFSIKGSIEAKHNNKYVERKEVFLNERDSYSEYRIYNKDKSKVYFINPSQVDNDKYIKKGDEIYIPTKELFDTLDIKFRIELDNEKKFEIFYYN
jgi:hypothetical protein